RTLATRTHQTYCGPRAKRIRLPWSRRMKPERWQHIDKLLGEALELEAGRRAAFLDQACAGDHDLRRKIDGSLAAHEQAERPAGVTTRSRVESIFWPRILFSAAGVAI